MKDSDVIIANFYWVLTVDDILFESFHEFSDLLILAASWSGISIISI